MRGLLARPSTPDPSPATMIVDDEAMLVAAARADPREFAPLYSRYVDPVYRYCYRRLGHPEAAADATSQVFAKALAALPGYREEGKSFRSWLFTIAHNVLVDEFRTHRWTITLDAAVNVVSSSPALEDQVLTNEVGCMIHDLLAQLSPNQRQVMELRLAGLTGAEIATAVGRSLGSVRIDQFRAISQMRTELGVTVHPRKGAQDDQR